MMGKKMHYSPPLDDGNTRKNMTPEFYKIFAEYREIAVRYDEPHKAVWCYFNPAPRPCFSLQMLQDLRLMQQNIIDFFNDLNPREEAPIRYLIVCSQIPGIYNLGGDLSLFISLIREQKKKQLLDYAIHCIDNVYLNAVSMNLPVTTVSLVEGTALGGGFETALSGNLLIATEEAEMGFPEIRFNLFPGMGAYSLLARLVGTVATEKIIGSGTIYSAGELHDMGIVNHLVGSDNVRENVERILRQHSRSDNGFQAMILARHRCNPITFQELEDIVRIWVDAALRLTTRDLKMMKRLIKAQQAKMQQQEKRFLLRTKQDRRFSGEDVTFPLTDSSGQTIHFDRRHNDDRRRGKSNLKPFTRKKTIPDHASSPVVH